MEPLVLTQRIQKLGNALRHLREIVSKYVEMKLSKKKKVLQDKINDINCNNYC